MFISSLEVISSLEASSNLLEQFSLNLSIFFTQVHVSGAYHTPNKLSKIPIVQGELHPILQAKNPNSDSAANSKLPTIVITSHIDNFGILNVSIVIVLSCCWIMILEKGFQSI